MAETTVYYALDVVGLPEVIYTSEGNSYLHLPGVIRAENSTGEVRYLLSDGLGSIRQAVDETADIVSSDEYDPYGNPLTFHASRFTPYGYTGEWWEQDVGLLHLRARWYLAEDGVFVSRDPWAGDDFRPQTLNGWSYVEGNPTNRTDPSGMKSITPWDQYYLSSLQGQSSFPSYGPASSILLSIDIIKDPRSSSFGIAERAINKIIANFEGIMPPEVNIPIPCYIGSTFPNDLTNYNTQPIYPQRNYNRYDALISGWVDYWKWHGTREGRYYVSSLDPNFVKAIAYGETVMGYGGSNSGYYGVMQMDDVAIDSLQTLDWGGINIKQNPIQPAYNIGGGIRWLIFKYEGIAQQESWEKAYACYFGTCDVNSKKVQDIIDVYETGKDMHSEAHQLFQ